MVSIDRVPNRRPNIVRPVGSTVVLQPVVGRGPEGPTGPGGSGALELAVGASVPGATPADTLVYRAGPSAVTQVAAATRDTVGTTLSPTLTADVAAGDSLIVAIAYRLNGAAEIQATVTDPRGNVWVQSAHTRTGSATGIVIFYSNIANRLQTGQSITVSFPLPNLQNFAVVVGSVQGLLYPSGADQTGTSTGSGSSVSVPTSGSTTQAVEVAVMAIGSQFNSASGPGAGWALTGSIKANSTVNDKRVDLMYRTTSATGVVTGTATGGTGAWCAAIATFKVDPAPRLEGIWDGSTVDTTYPLGKPVKGGMGYFSTDTGVQRWRRTEVDPRDFAYDTAGIFGTGNATKDTACMVAAMAACGEETGGIAGGLTLKLPTGPISIETPLVRRAPYTVKGAGIYATVLKPTAALVGQWLWTDENMNRAGTRILASTSVNVAVHDAGPTHGGFSLFGDRTLGVIHGYRTTGSIDDQRIGSFGVYYFGGIGVRIGDPNPAAGLAQGGIVRECDYLDIRVEQCGDDTATGDAEAVTSGGVNYGLPAFDFCQARDGVTSTDGSNQVNFKSLWTVYNHGTNFFRNNSSGEVMRKITIGTWMLHGHSGGGQTKDLAVIEGMVRSVKILDLRTNNAPTGKACVLLRGDTSASKRPRVRMEINVSQSDGDGVVVEDADSVTITGITDPTQITNYEVRFAATSTISPGQPAVGLATIDVGSQTATTRKFSIPANSADLTDFRGLTRTATTAQLTDKTSVVNTLGKHTSRWVRNTTSKKVVYADGPNDTDHWYDAAGVDTHTPV